MSQINPEDFDVIVCVITKECIANSNFEEVLGFYEYILHEPLKYENKLNLMVKGYEDDPRELYEIEEVRAHFSVLDRLFPYWFYFLNKTGEVATSPLGLIASLLVPIECLETISGEKYIQYDTEKFIEFMNIHFHYLNELTDKLGLSLEENKRISVHVAKCFDNFE